MAVLTPQPKMQFLTAAGDPLVGGKVFTYSAGTTTPAVTYVDSAQTTPNTNPIILDSRGEANIWLGAAAYKFTLTDANDVEIWTVDYISAPTSGVSPALSGNVTITSDTPGPALKITQIGTGPVLRVQDSVDPDTTPFIIDANGSVGIGTATPATPLDVTGAGRIGSLTLTGAPLPVASGGTGRNTLTADNVVLGNGTGSVGLVAPGTSGNLLTSNGTTWESVARPAEVASQTGNAGKLLTTNGTTTAWSTDSVVRARASVTDGTSATCTVGTGAVNIASVTQAAGVYTVTFTTALASANYQVLVTITSTGAQDDRIVRLIGSKLVGSFTIVTYDISGNADTAVNSFDFVVFGGW